MLLDTFRNTLVKKFFGNDLVARLVKYLLKCPHYWSSGSGVEYFIPYTSGVKLNPSQGPDISSVDRPRARST